MTVTEASNLKVIDVNQAFMNSMGYSREEVIGKTDMELNLFADSPGRKSMKEALWKFGSVHNMDLKMQNKSGEIREGLFSAEVIESQGKRYYLSVMIDITERKRAEREVLLQSKMQSLLTHIAKACINMPLEGMHETVEHFLGEISQFMRVQRAYVFEYYWDRKVTSVLYEWCENGVASQKENFQNLPLSPLSAWIKAHLVGKSFYVPDILALPEDSNVRQILEPHNIRSLIAVPMLEGTECLGFVSFDSLKEDRDYSPREQALLEIFAEIMVNLKIRRTLENRLVKEKDKALTASKAKSEFLANMSHEIRTPLNGVIGFTDLLQNTPLSPIQEQYVRNANASGHTLLGIVSDILDFSKIEAGKLELEIVKTDLIDLVEQSVNIVRYEADRKKVEVLLDLDLTMPRYAFVDPVRLKQVLANLLSNAVKFTEKGEVALKVRCSLKEPGRGVFSFYVRDTGIGIEEKGQEKLFRAFSQADGSTTRRFGGTGLGLAISDSLVRQMGGVIELHSIPDRGSTFFFSIEASCEEGERADLGHIEGISRVLVIDDNANNRVILEHMLAHWGIEFVGAEDIPEALKILKQAEKPFDVLIVDYHMPYLNGLEGIRMVRDNLKLSAEEQPVVLLHSSSDDAELSERCRKLGVRFRLIKPIYSEELFAYLSSIRKGIPEEFAEKRSETFPLFIEENDRITVAIAEDDSINRILVSTLVRKFLPSARILEAHTGREAVDMAKRDMPDLLFMDVQMPEMDGNEATRRIREDEGAGKRHLPIVGLTAGALESEREKSLEAGMDVFLTKPIEITKFQEVLKEYVDSLQKSSKEKECSPSEEILHFDAYRLVQELGDSQALKTLAGASRVVLPKMLEFLEKSLEQENMKDLAKAVSIIGSSASVMHFIRLRNLTDSLETFCADKSCNFEEAEEMVLALRQEWNFLATLLEREFWKEYR